MSVNKVILIGNAGTNPEIRYIETQPIATFRLATSERERTSADGSKIPERTEWHNIVMWGKAAEFAEKYIRTGSKLYIEGKLRYRTWEDRTAIKRSITEIYVDNFEILGMKQ